MGHESNLAELASAPREPVDAWRVVCLRRLANGSGNGTPIEMTADAPLVHESYGCMREIVMIEIPEEKHTYASFGRMPESTLDFGGEVPGTAEELSAFLTSRLGRSGAHDSIPFFTADKASVAPPAPTRTGYEIRIRAFDKDGAMFDQVTECPEGTSLDQLIERARNAMDAMYYFITVERPNRRDDEDEDEDY